MRVGLRILVLTLATSLVGISACGGGGSEPDGEGGTSGAGSGGSPGGGGSGHGGGGTAGTGNEAGLGGETGGGAGESTGGSGETGGSGGDACSGVTCSGHGTCRVISGSARCNCDAGYVREDRTKCVDVDECATNNGGCDPRTTCTNTPGGRTCGECPPGYTGDGESGCVSNPCEGGPVVGCTCVKVTAEGDDALASQNRNETPFRSVQAAIDFADAHRDIATDVCVAGGTACSARASFPGPSGADLVMREGISVYGSYESSTWTPCDDITTALAPTTAAGVLFGADIDGPTRLERFEILRLAAETTTAVTVRGASGVRLSLLDLTGPLDQVNSCGVDLSAGADATLSAVTIPDSTTAGTILATGLAFGVRAVGSRVTIEDSDFNLILHESGSAYGIWLENAGESRIVATHVSVEGTGEYGYTQPASVTTGVRIAGEGDIDIVGSTIGFGSEGALEQYGVDVTDAERVALTATSLAASGSIDRTAGVRALGTRLVLDGVELVMSARNGETSGISLEDTPASIVGGRISLSGSGTFTGVRSVGSPSFDLQSSVNVAGGSEALGVVLMECADAEPPIAGSVTVSATTDGSAVGIRALGDCHPRIEAGVSASGRNAIAITGIECGTAGGTASRCSIVRGGISTEITRTGLAQNSVAIGVLCAGGCAEITDSGISGPTQSASECFRSCGTTSYGIQLVDTSPPVTGGTVRAGCADRAAAIHATGSSSLVENNDLEGSSCTYSGLDNWVFSGGIVDSGRSLDVRSNTIHGGGSPNVVNSCVSAAVIGGVGGSFRNNTLRPGRCPEHYGFADARYAITGVTGLPAVLVDNGFDPNASALYAFWLGPYLTTIAEVNALPIDEVNGNYLLPPASPLSQGR